MFNRSQAAPNSCLVHCMLGASLLFGCSPSVQAQLPFAPYAACSLPGGSSVVERTPLASGASARTVQTLHGPYDVLLVAGERLMFAYPNEDFYANVKVELLPQSGYASSRAALVADFDHTLASSEGTSRNYRLRPELHGFDIWGLDKEQREGGVLGIYLLFDDRTHVVTTIYFLNQEPNKLFRTMEQYRALRDRFLEGFTACVRAKLS